MPHILIVDDEAAICWSLKRALQGEGHSVETVSSAELGLDAAARQKPDAIVLDVRLPGMSGLAAIPRFKKIDETVPIVLVTAFGDLATAVEAVQNNVSEYLSKPFDLDHAVDVIRTALASKAYLALAASNGEASSKGATFEHVLVGHSSAMQEVFKKIALAASCDVPVLITGESGTGKELAAAAIHFHSQRRGQPYVPVALPALNPNLIESELFGHVKGAYTGANEKREGLFEFASGGTLLLDEIGDLPMPQQVKLLRVIEQGHFQAVGEARPRKCNVRILAATHQNLLQRMDEELFRRDLYFRLAVFEIRMPPLRERLEDLPLLCKHHLQRIGYPHYELPLEEETLIELRSRSWSGNVRELRNTLEHAALMARGNAIQRHHLPSPQSLVQERHPQGASLEESVQRWVRNLLHRKSLPTESTGDVFDQFLAVVEPILLRECLETTKGNRVHAANLLGIHRATLREKLRRYGMSEES